MKLGIFGNASGKDYFENGKFIKSENRGYVNAPTVPQIVDITGFVVHENVDLVKFIAVPEKSLRIQE